MVARINKILSSLFVILTVMFMVTVPYSANANDSQEGLAKWTLCNLFTFDGMGEKTYSLVYTDWPYFMLRSKNTVNDGADSVDSLPNRLLSINGGTSFVENNKNILGYSPTTKTIEQDSHGSQNTKPIPNGGRKLSVYERFGVAGLNFSSYLGEWKYVDVKVCSGETSDVHANAYYDNRQEPLSTWQDRYNSDDVRTQRINDVFGEANSVFIGFITGFLFSILKLFFVLCSMFISLSFTDVVNVIGLDSIIYGNGQTTGILGGLFSGIFLPLFVMVAMLVAVRALYLFGRQGKSGFIQLVQMFTSFILGIVFLMYPSVLAIPNNVAVVGQSIVANSFSSLLTNANSPLCESSNNTQTGSVSFDSLDSKKANVFMKNLGDRVSNNINCFLWETVLFDNWSKIQFGTGYDDLWDKSTKKPVTLLNSDSNASIVGDAFVPLGGGQGINNWAVYHLSTQTDAHAKTGAKDVHDKPVYNSGVANDWYRIVDATSNVFYKNVDEKLQGMNESISYQKVDGSSRPTKVWSVWSGENNMYRLGMAFMSLFMGAVTLILPTFFGSLAVIFAIILTLYMIIMPLILLYSTTSSQGTYSFKKYLATVLDLVIKRTIVGGMLILSVSLLSTVYNIFDTIFISNIVSMFIVVAIITQWHKIVDLLKLPLSSFTSNSINKQFGNVLYKTKMLKAGVNAGVVAKKVDESAGKAFTGSILKMSSNNVLRNVGDRIVPSVPDTTIVDNNNRFLDVKENNNKNSSYHKQFRDTYFSSRAIHKEFLDKHKQNNNVSGNVLFMEEFVSKLVETISYELETMSRVPAGVMDMATVSGNSNILTNVWVNKNVQNLNGELTESILGWLSYKKIDHGLSKQDVSNIVSTYL